jgi:hypothetical protein
MAYISDKNGNLHEINTIFPNKYVINYSKKFFKKLLKKNIYPDRISPSTEKGICFTFKNKDEILYFEIYNDKDAGYITENSKKKITIKNEKINNRKEIINILKDFYDK